MLTTFRRRTFALALVLTAGMVAQADAQELCNDGETIAVCWERLKADALAKQGIKNQVETLEREKKAQEKAGQKTETSLADTIGLSSSVKDFLPLLQVSGLLGKVQADDDSGVINVALNTPFLFSKAGDEREKQLQLKAAIESKPKLYAGLEKLLPEENRADVAAKIVAGKKNAQNFTLSASYNISSARLGRSFARQSGVLNSLFEQTQIRGGGFGQVILEVVDRMAVGFNVSSTLWDTLSASDRRVIEEILRRVVAADIANDILVAKRVKENGLDVYGQLVLNQPQLQISASRTFRDDLFGPNLTTVRASFEMGIRNSLNAALGKCRSTSAGNGANCLPNYRAFTQRPGTRAAIKAGTRVAAHLELVHNEDFQFSSTTPVLNLIVPAGTGWSFAVDAGRLFGVDDEGTADGRVDLSVKFEDPAGATAERRFVTSLTVTKKLGELSVPFSIVYANKEKYLTGVDYGLSANVGLKFNLFAAAK